MIKFTAPLSPVTFKRPMQHQRTRYNDPTYTEFKAAFGLFARRAMNGRPPLIGYVTLTANFYRRKPKSFSARNWGDLDNLLKAILDAMNGICFIDDSQIVELHARKCFGDPRIEVEMEAEA